MSYVVLGLGRTGLSSIRYLLAQGATVKVADNREKPPNLKIFQEKYPQVECHLGEFPLSILEGAKAVLVSPGLARTDPIFEAIEKAKVPVWGDIELFAQNNDLPVVGITGSNGKSTVTTLVGEMAKKAGVKSYVGGNIGVPALDLLTVSKPQAFVLELSSFQLELTHSLRPKVAAILNLSADHLDRHGSMEAYIEAKHRIYHGASVGVYNRQDPNTKPKQALEQTMTFGLDEPQEGEFGLREVQGERLLCYGSQVLMGETQMSLFGEHNVLNALSALAIGHAMGLAFEPMIETLKTFTDLKHRCQLVKNMNGVLWINDSKGTNVGATVAALKSVSQRIEGQIVLIAGGKAKDFDFSQLQPLVKQSARQVLLIGHDAPSLDKSLRDYAPCEMIKGPHQMKSAVERAHALAQSGDAVLLSPACTSLDRFANFEERGEAFLQAIHEL